MSTNAAFLVVLAASAALACAGGDAGGEEAGRAAAARLSGDVARALRGRTIFFGHQSVGYDIVGGLAALAKERPDLGLRVAEVRSADELSGPVFAHGPIGRNGDPLGKIAAFEAALEAGLGERVDVALFKFCYVDFEPGTDVEAVFARYEETMARLRRRFPRVRFVHVTVPLTTVQSGPKALVRRLLGRRIAQAEENVVRERYNALVRGEYLGVEPVFDLAAAESTRVDGSPVRFEHRGASHPRLAGEYASDGKHLNAGGGRWVAAHLLASLAQR
jgi:hypothetical protein